MFGSFGLYTHIQANRRRSYALLAGLLVLVLLATFGVALVARGLGWAAPVRGGLEAYLRAAARDTLFLSPVAALVAFAWTFVGYRFHQGLIDGVTASAAAGLAEDGRVRRLLEPLCISRGMTMPAIKVAEDGALNAFATGMNPGQYAVTVTRGLLEALDDAELEAVLAHELTHIRNDDVRLMVIAVVIAGGLSLLGEMAFRGLDLGRGLGASRREKGSFPAVLIGLALIGIAWLLSLLIRFGLSRSREYLADAGAVELTKNPDAMIAALLKIEGNGELARAPSGVMELCVDNPRSGFADLFATHPPIAARVEALVRNAGGRLPAPPEVYQPPFLTTPWGRPEAG